MNVEAFLDEVRSSPKYADQMVYVRRCPSRDASFADPRDPLSPPAARVLGARGFDRLYSHQARALDAVREGRDVLISTGTASGKSLCYVLPIIEMLHANPDDRAVLLFPTKALSQDQFRGFGQAMTSAGLGHVLAGVYDGDTPSPLRRKLRDKASVLFTNPDMLHSALMPQHGRWAELLSRLKLLVIDEIHVYNGMFGANMANLLRRLWRVCEHYGSRPQIVACSATIGNPLELAHRLTGRSFELIEEDGSPHGRRTYVFWNPPRIRERNWHSRRSANVEAHELMAMLVQRGVATITFSKAKMTAEMIHRYVCETLQRDAPHLISKVTPYRGGYRPEERREIERQLFEGKLLGVSATRALELGIDVGALEAAVIVGYPGTLASFLQQSGRAGRRDRDAMVFLVGLDTAINQYVMSTPDYLFDRPVEQAVIDPDNPFVITNHVRSATHELPLSGSESLVFGPHVSMVLRVLQDNHKVRLIDDRWYHAAGETPQHEFSLRDTVDANVIIEDIATGEAIGEVNRLDAPPILHPEAIYLHHGETYRVQELDLERNLARVQKVDVDYYTNPKGGTDVHHIDHQLREKPFGTGRACWGEVTAYFNTYGYEKIHFYSLDPVSFHPVELPTFSLETMGVWIIPPEDLMEKVRRSGLDAHGGLRGIGYGTRMLLPLFLTCDTLDFSHTIGSANSPWNTIFIYERYVHGLGFTRKAYELLHRILPAVLENLRNCPCDDGCPCCTGKPLRQYATWYYDLGEASIPSKAAARMVLEGLLGDGTGLDKPDDEALTDEDEADRIRLEQMLRRRLERAREPKVFHPIEPVIGTEVPQPEPEASLETPDVVQRGGRRRQFEKELRRRLAKRIEDNRLDPLAAGAPTPSGMNASQSRKPTSFPGRPEVSEKIVPEPDRQTKPETADQAPAEEPTIPLGDALARRARRRKKAQDTDQDHITDPRGSRD
jgi:DEAD/DEAH box helicase domain-containing protein